MSIVWIDAEGFVLTSPRVSWKTFEKVLAELQACLNSRVKHQTAAAAMSGCPALFDLLKKKALGRNEQATEQLDLNRLPQFVATITEGGQDAPDRESEVPGRDQGGDSGMHGVPVV